MVRKNGRSDFKRLEEIALKLLLLTEVKAAILLYLLKFESYQMEKRSSVLFLIFNVGPNLLFRGNLQHHVLMVTGRALGKTPSHRGPSHQRRKVQNLTTTHPKFQRRKEKATLGKLTKIRA